MKPESFKALSRRSFLKTNSLFLLGRIIMNDPLVRLVAGSESPFDGDTVKWAFSVELLRKTDLLQLKYYFYNAYIHRHQIRRKDLNNPVLVYIKVPGQHIAEELVDPATIHARGDFKRKRSFLSGCSWIGFEVHENALPLSLDPDTLLDWSGKFNMLTLESFYQRRSDPDRTTRKNVLDAVKLAFESQPVPDGQPVLQNANDKLAIPLTTFEIPYKIWLSPIAEPITTDPLFQRQDGEHVFTAENQQQILYVNKAEKDRHFQIFAVWENSMMFRDKLNNLTTPRFKVARSLCPDTTDSGVSLLLPVPFNRYELKGLTMRPEFDRDVTSDYFRISSFGGTAHLKYKNDDPTPDFALVAWDQIIKYGRDNYVSITYRAVCAITGFKTTISVIAERTFQFGVSYLPRLYHVDYFEKEKTYKDPIVISAVPFYKLVPKIAGAFFYPESVPDPGTGTDGAYLVTKPDNRLSTFDPSQLLEFGYTGYDKDNNPHDLLIKMILIPAETYVIKSGTYLSVYNGKKYDSVVKPYVPVTDIGDLNPAQQTKFDGHAPPADCPPSRDNLYKFELVKTFSTTGKPILDKIIQAVRNHIQLHSDVYFIQINKDICYARIQALRENGTVDKDSANTTLKTSKLLLWPQLDTQITQAIPVADLFISSNFPIAPAMSTAMVIIPQIDQIQGRSEYHEVSYHDTYSILKDDLEKSHCPAKIFLKLTNPLSNFFGDNYRSSGAVVNPGIQITHISALDNSISFNDTVEKVGDMTQIPAVNIFREIKGSILGIPILEIIQDILPLANLPQFNFVGQLEQSIKQFEQLAQQFQSIAADWASQYQGIVNQVNAIQQQIADAERTFQLLSKGNLTTFFDTITSQQQVRALYKSQMQALNDSEAVQKYKDYVKNVLSPFLIKFETIFPISGKLADLLKTPTSDKIKDLLITLHTNGVGYNEVYCKEVVKTYLIQKFQAGDAPEPVYALLNAVASYYRTVDQTYLSYCNAINQGMQEAIDFSAGLVQKQFEKVDNQVNSLINSIPDYINKLIKQAGIILGSKELNGWVAAVNRLIKIYDDYYRLYLILKKDYYLQLQGSFGMGAFSAADFNDLEKKLISRFSDEVKALQNAASDAPDEVKQAYGKLQDKLVTAISPQVDAFTNYVKYYEVVRTEVNNTINTYTNQFKQLYNEYDKEYQDLQKLRDSLKDPKEKLKNFARNQLQKIIDDQLPKAQAALQAAKGTSDYQNALAKVNDIQAFLQKVKSLTHQTLHYTIGTSQFRRASLANVIEFIPNEKTNLTLNVTYDVQLSLTSFDKPPVIAKQSFVTDTTLANFKVGLLQLLYVDFEKVSFTAGSDIKDAFTVRIRDVDFGGFLSFFDAFKDYLKSLSDNLAFDITTAGATIGYALKIPDFTTGYFNFFNLGLSASMFLPFNPDKSLELRFGIGSDQSKFGLTLAGIFGGQGYFDIIADPKKGIIGMDIVLEFGAIFHLDLAGIVEGTAYLVGGIYIRQYDGQYALKAYILCVGKLRIIGIFSTSLSFYLGLEGDGHLLSGVCVLTASFKMGPFFEISVQCEMRKEIAGTKSTETSSNTRLNEDAAVVPTEHFKIADSNLHRTAFHKGDYLFVTLEDPANKVTSSLTSNGKSVIPATVNIDGKHKYIGYETDKLKSGHYEINLTDGINNLTKTFSLVDDKMPDCLDLEQDKIDISDDDYYASYYYNYEVK